MAQAKWQTNMEKPIDIKKQDKLKALMAQVIVVFVIQEEI